MDFGISKVQVVLAYIVLAPHYYTCVGQREVQIKKINKLNFAVVIIHSESSIHIWKRWNYPFLSSLSSATQRAQRNTQAFRLPLL